MRRMIVWLTLSLCCAATVVAAPTELFFSEYVEGSSNNKALEIYNGTGAAVDLAAQDYKIEMYFNGATTAGLTVNLTGTIAPSGTFVVTNASASATIRGVAQQITTATGWFNGDDAVVLKHGSTIVDSIGQVGFDPGTEWGTGLISTADNTIRRKANVCGGDTTATDAFDPVAQWDGFATDTFSDLGSYIASCGTGNQTNPAAAGTASPASLQAGNTTTLTVTVTPGDNPPSTSLAVVADLTSIGGSNAQAFAAGPSNTFTFTATVALGTSAGAKSLPVTVSDGEGRSGSTSIALTVEMPPAVNDHIVISQIYGSGGNSSATYNRDFVELYNPTLSSTFDVTGWSIQYSSASGTSYQVQPLAGLIKPGEYYLIALGAGSVGASLPDANTVGDLLLGATAGKIALVSDSNALSGVCPVGDTRIVDYVGYGTTANCKEGSGAATAPSNNQTAMFRKSGGAIDTNNNNTDFEVASVNPRRTATIAEVGPRVTGIEVTEASGTLRRVAPVDPTFTVSFSEPVNVDADWNSVVCATSGAHASTSAHNPNNKTWAIALTTNVQPGEQCTVTIFKGAVHDVDEDDSGLNTDTLIDDVVSTFTVITLTDVPFNNASTYVHLTMGNPSGAVEDVTVPNNYLMKKPEFALSYNRDRGTPNWVSWHLSSEWLTSGPRRDSFRPDPALPSDWYHVQAFDFFNTGYSRGHMAPSFDRLPGTSVNDTTFLMTNMLPQTSANNSGPWGDLENDLRALVPGNEIYIVAGGAGSNGTLAGGKVTVPAVTWKVALVLPKGEDDVNRVTAAAKTIAVIMPNTQTLPSTNWRDYLKTVDAVEALTGYDFFANVDDIVENAIEAGKEGVNPPGVANQSVSVDEDASRAFNLQAVNSTTTAPTFTVLTQPTHGTLTGGADGAETYTPVPNFNGTDSFTFRASDANGNSNTATVAITVLEINDAPVATDDAKSTNEDTTLTLSSADLTANDVAGPADEHQTLTVSAVSAGADTHGTVSVSSGLVSYVPAENYNGPASFTYTVCDDGITRGLSDPRCATATVNVNVVPVNDPPSAAITVTPTSVEGSAVTATVAVTDVDDNAFTYAWSVTKNGAPFAASSNPAFTFTTDDNGSYVVSVSVSDPAGATGTDSKTVAVSNASPVIVSVTGPLHAMQLGTPATITVNYADAGSADTHTAVFAWDDGSSSTATCAAGICTATHTFASTGVYSVAITVTDDDGGAAPAEFDSVVITDANGGWVNGGGFIESPAGKVTFAFTAQYQKSGNASGNTEVQLAAGNFKGSSIEWLVVAGANAQYTGTGTINGAGTYGYQVTVQDGDAIARGNADKFRIRIWDSTTGAVVYDNVAGASNDIDAANPQPIGGGSIVVH